MTKSNKNAISISYGNKKMGHIPSVSLPPIITCKNCSSCAKKCYAAKLCRIILNADRNEFFNQVAAVARISGFFRYHVSGDIIDIDYLDRMCKLARKCKNTKFLAFTKNYQDVNEYFKSHKKPSNLQLLFSLPFNGATIDNPHNLPTAAVILKGNEPKKNYKICGGNCSECANCGIGCWELRKGETIAFYEH